MVHRLAASQTALDAMASSPTSHFVRSSITHSSVHSVHNSWAGNITMGGNAPLKIKTWPNTTGELSNLLYEDITMAQASTAIDVSAWYGAWACPCRWIHNFHGPGQQTKCHNINPCNGSSGPSCSGGIGGLCGTQGDATNNINMKNITFRRIRGAVDTPGSIVCRAGNPCTILMEDVQLTTSKPWVCGNAHIETRGSQVVPALPKCGSG